MSTGAPSVREPTPKIWLPAVCVGSALSSFCGAGGWVGVTTGELCGAARGACPREGCGLCCFWGGKGEAGRACGCGEQRGACTGSPPRSVGQDRPLAGLGWWVATPVGLLLMSEGVAGAVLCAWSSCQSRGGGSAPTCEVDVSVCACRELPVECSQPVTNCLPPLPLLPSLRPRGLSRSRPVCWTWTLTPSRLWRAP